MLLNNVSTNLNNQLINSYLYQKTNPYLSNVNTSFSNSSSFKPAYILDLSHINREDSLNNEGLIYTKEEVLERSKAVDLNKIKELLPEESKKTLDDIINNLSKSEDKGLTERLLKVLGNDVIPSLEENELNSFMDDLSQITGLLSKENPELLDDFVTTLEAVEGESKDKFLKVTKSLLEMVYEEAEKPKSKKLLTIEDLKGLIGEGKNPVEFIHRKGEDSSSPIQSVWLSGPARELFPEDDYSFDLTTIPRELVGWYGHGKPGEPLNGGPIYNLMDEGKIYIEAPEAVYEVSLGEDKEIAVNIVDEEQKESLSKSENYYQMKADESCFFKVGENDYAIMTVGEKEGYSLTKEDLPTDPEKLREDLSKATLASPSEEEVIEGFFKDVRKLSEIDSRLEKLDTDFSKSFLQATSDLLKMLDKRYEGFEEQFGEVKNVGKLITILDFFKDTDNLMGNCLDTLVLKGDALNPVEEAAKPWTEDFFKPYTDTLFSMASSDEYHRRSSREKLLGMGDEFMGEEIKHGYITELS